ncbi:MAG: hypothetical protein M3Z22_06275 [Verrucomicrobiota bacterium]|nr:hypothetical protein [Verrucomicrobiota bacterium]
MNKSTALFLLVAISLYSNARGQDSYARRQDSSKEIHTAATTTDTERTALDILHIDSSYVLESDLHRHGTSYGDQDALQNAIEYSHRFLISGKIYLRLGFSYERFDFGSTSAPVPNHLQSLAGLVALEYMVGNDVGAFISVRPGYYTENDFRQESFDYPITLGRIFVLQQNQLYLFVGANAAFLRGQYPILPLAGLIWRPSAQWNVYAILPEPRVTYSPSKRLSFYAGGQLVGSSFRTDRNDGIVPHRLSNAQIDYSEYRAGLGVEFHPCDHFSVNLGGGYDLLRRMNFDRANVEFKSDPAPYARLAFRAEF